MKCDLCSNKIEETFLEKINGMYIKINSKIKTICSDCQKKYSIQEIKDKLK